MLCRTDDALQRAAGARYKTGDAPDRTGGAIQKTGGPIDRMGPDMSSRWSPPSHILRGH